MQQMHQPTVNRGQGNETMQSFNDLWDTAANRKGGAEALEALLPPPTPRDALEETPDSRLLSAMSRRVFQAGFNWAVVDKKWPDHEAAFNDFNINHCAFLSDEDLDALTRDPRVVRHFKKIQSVRDNANLLVALAREHGSAARFIAATPDEEYIALLDYFEKNGSRLGGVTLQIFLRDIGKDGFILSKDVLTALQRERVITGKGTSKRERHAAQEAFNTWRAQSQRPFAHISRILAFTV
ncbi:3-methyladenine DNA glycosylase Tag [Limibacillus sp. MBR-115]